MSGLSAPHLNAQEDQVAYRAAIRACDPLLCLHRALAAMLVERYSFEGIDFPDPQDKDRWCATMRMLNLSALHVA
jgi:hypothetical protein